MPANPPSGRVLVFAPRGRNAALLVSVLARAGVVAAAFPDVASLCVELGDATGAVVLSEEALGRASLAVLVAALGRQPPWSEIPLVILTGGGVTTRGSIAVADALGPRATFTLLERPVRILTLLAAVRTAVRARQRQYEVKALLASEQAAREQAEASAAEAGRASRLKDEFLTTLSHELRTPLNAILGWSQLLERRPDDQAMRAEGVAAIVRNARVQTRLIEDLLDMSRITAGKMVLDPQPVDTREVVAAAVDAVRLSVAGRQIRLTVDLGPTAGVVSADPARLQQAFWNLLVNAVKFTPAGGEVRVSVRRVVAGVEVHVGDNGQGIAPEFLPFIFDRFRQGDGATNRRHGGLGIGLAIVKQVVELHGGSVRAQSDGPGRGALFVVALPLAATSEAGADAGAGVVAPHAEAGGAASGPTPTPTPTPIDLGGVRVLVVDDEPDALSLARRVLEDGRASVVTAGSASAALAALARERPDVLVSDIGMPTTDGYELIRRVRLLAPEDGGHTPAAAVTAFAGRDDRERALRAGFQSHVAKPVEPAQLLSVVAKLAGRPDRGSVA